MNFEVDSFDDGFEVNDDFSSATKIMVFGVGGGGGNAVSHMVNAEVGFVEYVVANTDVVALRSKDGSRMSRIQIGRKTTRGQGAGNDTEKGKTSAEESREEISKALNGVSMLFIAAGMGGGTGTGAAPIVASLAKEKDILTVGVVTKPFDFEGAHKMQQAIKGISEMKQNVDALIVIPNDRVRQLKGSNITIKNAFEKVDEILCKAVTGIISLVQGSGYINVDFADIRMALKNSGIAHMAIGTGKGEKKYDDALDEIFNSPLLETSIEGARRGLLNIKVPASDSVGLDEFDVLAKKISEKFNDDARFKFGVEFDETLADDEISIIAVFTDFDDEPKKSAQQPKKAAPAQVQAAAPAEKPAEAPAPEPKPAPAPEPVEANMGYNESKDIELLMRKFQGFDN